MGSGFSTQKVGIDGGAVSFAAQFKVTAASMRGGGGAREFTERFFCAKGISTALCEARAEGSEDFPETFARRTWRLSREAARLFIRLVNPCSGQACLLWTFELNRNGRRDGLKYYLGK